MTSELQPSVLTRAFDELPMGVVILDADARVVFYNRYEEELAGRERSEVLGQNFFETVAPCTRVTGLGEIFRAKIGRERFHIELDFHFPRVHIPHPCDVHLELLSVAIDGDPYGALLVQDVSSIRAVERTKDLLTRLMSHDMRSPLTAAIGSTDLALADLDDREALERCLRDTQRSLRRIRLMLGDLNDVTQLKTRALPCSFQVFDFRELLDEIVSEKQALVGRTDQSLSVDAEPGPLLCRGTPRLIGRAIDNLLQNAVVHGAGESVRVRLMRDGGHVIVEVEDRGPGVPDSIASTLFEPGISASNAHQDAQNHGLGLALVRLVCDHHGGTAVHSAPDSGGARFRMTLPIDGPHDTH